VLSRRAPATRPWSEASTSAEPRILVRKCLHEGVGGRTGAEPQLHA
jgi:hypothetical protein